MSGLLRVPKGLLANEHMHLAHVGAVLFSGLFVAWKFIGNGSHADCAELLREGVVMGRIWDSTRGISDSKKGFVEDKKGSFSDWEIKT